jgi:pimeloyl-ACP methyl ester carboxylesterase
MEFFLKNVFFYDDRRFMAKVKKKPSHKISRQNVPKALGPSQKRDYLTSFDGTRIFYTSEGTGKALVFLHGLVCSHLHWHYQIDAFKKDYQVIWFDYRGHGSSGIPENPDLLTIQSIAKDLQEVLKAMQITEVVLIGHSMGVNIALEFMQLDSVLVKGLILSNGTLINPLENLLGTNFFNHVFQGLQVFFHKRPVWFRTAWKMQKYNVFIKAIVTLAGFNPFLTDPKDIAAYLDRATDIDPLVFLRLLADYQKTDLTQALSKIDVPTLIMGGQKDKVTTVAQQEMIHQLISRSQLDIVRHGSHCPQLDLPDLVTAKISAFLAEMSYS